ncbi:MAG: hypothetical protein GY754_30740 [bacterium]|nr:hypothetical protein [bacterium]
MNQQRVITLPESPTKPENLFSEDSGVRRSSSSAKAPCGILHRQETEPIKSPGRGGIVAERNQREESPVG